MILTLFSTAAQVAAPGQPTGIISLAWLMIAIPAVSSALLLVCGRRSDREEDPREHQVGCKAHSSSFPSSAVWGACGCFRPVGAAAPGIPHA